MKWRQAMLSLCLMAGARGADGASGGGAVQVTMGGQTRSVRIIGQPSDTEFYAPLTRPLRSLWLDVRPRGAAEVEVRYQGTMVACWPVVSGRERLSANPDKPVVLREGNELWVPVRAVVALGHGWLDWDERTRVVTITPTVRRLELQRGERGLEIRLEASAPVRVTSVPLAGSRVAIDITPAWFHLDETPRAGDMLRSVRLGQFTKTTARAVMELPEGAVRVTGLPQMGTTITAALQPGEGLRVTHATAPDTAVRSTGRRSVPGAVPASTGTDSLIRPPRTAIPPVGEILVHQHGRRALASRGGFRHRESRQAADEGVLAGKMICVDPGHGGSDPGALGLNGLREGDACLALAEQLARALWEAGATVLMTRDADRHVSLEERCALAQAQRPELFISIHCNASRRPNAVSGAETYYYTPRSLALAQALHAELTRVMAGRDGGVRQRRFAVIHRPSMPAVLLEVGYITHAGDEARLGDPAFQAQFGSALRDGVVRYLGK